MARTSRSTRDLLNILDTIAKAGAGFRSLADTWADTTTPHGKPMITILGGLAEFERHPILARPKRDANERRPEGVKFGRKRKLSDYQRTEAIKRRANGETLTAIARSYGVAASMISRPGQNRISGLVAASTTAATITATRATN